MTRYLTWQPKKAFLRHSVSLRNRDTTLDLASTEKPTSINKIIAKGQNHGKPRSLSDTLILHAPRLEEPNMDKLWERNPTTGIKPKEVIRSITTYPLEISVPKESNHCLASKLRQRKWQTAGTEKGI